MKRRSFLSLLGLAPAAPDQWMRDREHEREALKREYNREAREEPLMRYLEDLYTHLGKR